MSTLGKIDIINARLLLTGQSLVAVEDDGSNEWNVCSAAYDQGVAHLLEEHDWKFATEISGPLVRTGDATDTNFEYRYNKPTGCLHIVWVRLDGYPVDWKIIGGKIELTAGDGDVTVKFVKEPGSEDWPQMFISALNCLIDAGIYRGIKREEGEATKREAAAEHYLQKARTRTDQQEPKRALFKTTWRANRTQRRT